MTFNIAVRNGIYNGIIVHMQHVQLTNKTIQLTIDNKKSIFTIKLIMGHCNAIVVIVDSDFTSKHVHNVQSIEFPLFIKGQRVQEDQMIYLEMSNFDMHSIAQMCTSFRIETLLPDFRLLSRVIERLFVPTVPIVQNIPSKRQVGTNELSTTSAIKKQKMATNTTVFDDKEDCVADVVNNSNLSAPIVQPMEQDSSKSELDYLQMFNLSTANSLQTIVYSLEPTIQSPLPSSPPLLLPSSSPLLESPTSTHSLAIDAEEPNQVENATFEYPSFKRKSARFESTVKKPYSLNDPPNYLSKTPAFLNYYIKNAIICEQNGHQLRKEDVEVVVNQPLNDKVIMYFIAYYRAQYPSEPSTVILSPLFFSGLEYAIKHSKDLTELNSFTKDVDPVNCSTLIVPINENFQWFFVMIIGLKEFKRTIDANKTPRKPLHIVIMNSTSHSVNKMVKAPITTFISFLLQISETTVAKYVKMFVGNGPKQPEEYDSGLYALHSISMILQNSKIINELLKTKENWWGTVVEREHLLSVIEQHNQDYLDRTTETAN